MTATMAPEVMKVKNAFMRRLRARSIERPAGKAHSGRGVWVAALAVTVKQGYASLAL
jgi:hypothetical protein